MPQKVKKTHIGESLTASGLLTSVGLLASMRADVYCERTSLYKGLAASWLVALVRALVCVDAKVPLQVGFAVEAFAAVTPGALERAGGGVRFHNLEQVHSVGCWGWGGRRRRGGLDCIQKISGRSDFGSEMSSGGRRRRRGGGRGRWCVYRRLVWFLEGNIY